MKEAVAGKYSVFNAERVKRYAWLLTTKLRDRLDDIIEALEEEAEPRSVGLSVSKRQDDHLGDRIPNDWLEAVAIFLALMAITGAGIALYYLSEQV